MVVPETGVPVTLVDAPPLLVPEKLRPGLEHMMINEFCERYGLSKTIASKFTASGCKRTRVLMHRRGNELKTKFGFNLGQSSAVKAAVKDWARITIARDGTDFLAQHRFNREYTISMLSFKDKYTLDESALVSLAALGIETTLSFYSLKWNELQGLLREADYWELEASILEWNEDLQKQPK